MKAVSSPFPLVLRSRSRWDCATWGYVHPWGVENGRPASPGFSFQVLHENSLSYPKGRVKVTSSRVLASYCKRWHSGKVHRSSSESAFGRNCSGTTNSILFLFISPQTAVSNSTFPAVTFCPAAVQGPPCLPPRKLIFSLHWIQSKQYDVSSSDVITGTIPFVLVDGK